MDTGVLTKLLLEQNKLTRATFNLVSDKLTFNFRGTSHSRFSPPSAVIITFTLLRGLFTRFSKMAMVISLTVNMSGGKLRASLYSNLSQNCSERVPIYKQAKCAAFGLHHQATSLFIYLIVLLLKGCIPFCYTYSILLGLLVQLLQYEKNCFAQTWLYLSLQEKSPGTNPAMRDCECNSSCSKPECMFRVSLQNS